MLARVHVASALPAPAAAVWEEVKTTALLHEVAWPLLRFRPAPGTVLPERWPVGVPVALRLYLLGMVPLGPHRLAVESVDDEERKLQTRERSRLLRRWDHHIHVEALGLAHTRYTDAVDLDAGLLTPLVGAFARAFFRYRHRRLRSVARRLGQTPPRPSSTNEPDRGDHPA